MNNKLLRTQLVDLLTSENAHVNFDAAVKDFPVKLQGTRPTGAAHSPWETLEHLRITQDDILKSMRDGRHVSPEFPAGYWPPSQTPPDAQAWNRSVDAFRHDLNAIAELVKNDSNDLVAPIPHSDGKTILQRVLVAVDHNAYHLGELVLLRRLLSAW
jgi:hypothetical protein